ncbi:hypothetical protein OO007_18835 [Cocleimonas sp. KMM 6892]|jgi:hypothetical protein|uniref:hypothetical protein n=1 Tax=unclassified Cocleimonas TaxID=2639732 RepID=UPI002DB8CD85|nr:MULTISPECIES: hypothetical protein [unclassified Cocleimonas]MEB8434301.1 hypothetical protein [Cocleimonas sp. KMM 6892]MEC4717296.1 hypothetical protein [Cocleimonas sp. KMM 6895]MEC4746675.1 hypothetical protein [Cocleimonas sp. KMM 6896]
MKITNFLAMASNGREILSDSHGNNIAIICESCASPVLLIALPNQRGSDEKHPANCKGCGELYFLDIREHKEMLYVHKVQ